MEFEHRLAQKYCRREPHRLRFPPFRINSCDLPTVENCIYEDLIFPRPFVGCKFVIDDISSEDTSAVGVEWHFGRLSSRNIFHLFFIISKMKPLFDTWLRSETGGMKATFTESFLKFFFLCLKYIVLFNQTTSCALCIIFLS